MKKIEVAATIARLDKRIAELNTDTERFKSVSSQLSRELHSLFKHHEGNEAFETIEHERATWRRAINAAGVIHHTLSALASGATEAKKDMKNAFENLEKWIEEKDARGGSI